MSLFIPPHGGRKKEREGDGKSKRFTWANHEYCDDISFSKDGILSIAVT